MSQSGPYSGAMEHDVWPLVLDLAGVFFFAVSGSLMAAQTPATLSSPMERCSMEPALSPRTKSSPTRSSKDLMRRMAV